MPGYDRRGPEGEGPKTGRGLGRCNPENKDTNFDELETRGRGKRMGQGLGPRDGRGNRHRHRGNHA